MKKITFLLSILLSVTLFSQSHVWNGSAGDHDWFNATNWDAGTVPTNTSTVLIEGNGNETVVIDGAAAMAMTIDLPLQSTLTIKSNLTLMGAIQIGENASLIWQKGTLTGGNIQNNGLFVIEGSDLKDINGTNITNFAQLEINNSGVIHIAGSMTIHNPSTGQVIIDSNGGLIEDSGETIFNNEGYVHKLSNGSPGNFYMIFEMNNAGVIEIGDNQTFLFLVTSQNFNNLPNGILTGTGTFDITATFSNTGTIAPAGDGSTGTLDFVNNFHFIADTTLRIDVNSATDYDTLDIFSAPYLEGNLEVNLLSELQLEDELTVITNSNPSTCNLPSQVIATSASALYTFDVLCTTNSVILKVTQIEVLSTEEFSQESFFRVYPNPTKDYLSFEYAPSLLQDYPQSKIELFSVLGQKIASFPVKELTTQVAISNVPSGVYLALWVSEEQVLATTKLMVE
ncbi:MAG: T9SS type A sorting domain-containing protein [Flavobacteriaceae bacterium]